MRAAHTLLVAATLTLVSAPVFAGNLSLSDGKAQWQTTACVEPTAPASLLTVDKETHAGDMNKLMENYNAYSTNMQAYMDCVSKEAESDSGAVNQAITRSAQVTIAGAQNKVSAMHDALQSKQ